MTPDDPVPEPPSDDHEAEILALMQADENDEAVYGWMAEDGIEGPE